MIIYLVLGWIIGQVLPHVYLYLDPRAVDIISRLFEPMFVGLFGQW